VSGLSYVILSVTEKEEFLMIRESGDPWDRDCRLRNKDFQLERMLLERTGKQSVESLPVHAI
jgi:hypothetical protein